MDIVGRTTTETAVERILPLMELCQCSLDKSRRRTDQRCNPHPKYRACSTSGDCRNYTHKVSHTDSRCRRNNERLHAGKFSLGKVSLHLRIRLFNEHGYHFPEHSNRKKFCSERIINTCRNKQKYHRRQPQSTSSG